MNSQIKFAFFGTSQFSTIVLDELETANLVPELIITVEDKPSGRHLKMTHSPVKVWADKRNIPIFQPKTLKEFSVEEFLRVEAPTNGWDVFVVASYGKIIPENILNIPKHGAVNVHPSLLPKLRGSSPIASAILTEKITGVTIMHMDKEMDHGPIITQKKVDISEWPPYAPELEQILAHEGGRLLAEVLPNYVAEKINETPQNENEATFTKKIKKEDTVIDLADNPEKNLRKIRAYAGSANACAYFKSKNKDIRCIITNAHIENDHLVIEHIKPEGRNEMTYAEFERGFLKS
jgi:methionyl-tRNA formyltransferase